MSLFLCFSLSKQVSHLSEELVLFSFGFQAACKVNFAHHSDLSKFIEVRHTFQREDIDVRILKLLRGIPLKAKAKNVNNKTEEEDV